LSCAAPTAAELEILSHDETVCRPDFTWCSENPFTDRQPPITGIDEHGDPDSIPTARFFAATWTGYLRVINAGTYNFWVNIGILDSATVLIRPQGADDSAWTELIDLDCETTPDSGSIYLEAGVYEILVRYSDYGFTDCMELEWSGPDTGGERVPLDQHLQPIEIGDCFDTAGGPGKSGGPGKGVSFNQIRHHF